MRSRFRLSVFLVVIGSMFGWLLASGRMTDALGQDKKAPHVAADGEQLPKPDPEFKGKIGDTYRDSTPDNPQPEQAPKGAPNVLLVLLDDVGFGMCSTFGGPVPTPHLDKLAKNGLIHNQFHTTALCSPTRAALLTGRNHHSCGTGVIIDDGDRLSRLHGNHPEERVRCGSNTARQRLRDGHVRQGTQHA